MRQVSEYALTVAIAVAVGALLRVAGVHSPESVKPYVLPVLWVGLALAACVGLLRRGRQ